MNKCNAGFVSLQIDISNLLRYDYKVGVWLQDDHCGNIWVRAFVVEPSIWTEIEGLCQNPTKSVLGTTPLIQLTPYLRQTISELGDILILPLDKEDAAN